MTTLTALVLPESKRRDSDELRDRLDLDIGDTSAKRSAFWLMLTLAGVIATAGVLTDSTATVIGAMIIAPLSTPIMGTALAIVTGNGRRDASSDRLRLLGVVLVVGIGALGSLVVPGGDRPARQLPDRRPDGAGPARPAGRPRDRIGRGHWAFAHRHRRHPARSRDRDLAGAAAGRRRRLPRHPELRAWRSGRSCSSPPTCSP